MPRVSFYLAASKTREPEVNRRDVAFMAAGAKRQDENARWDFVRDYICSRRHLVRDADGWRGRCLYGLPIRWSGALPYRQKAGAAQRALRDGRLRVSALIN